ncbi:hypothetical protein AALA24_13265 [Anaerovoracaceae bacterium 42-11]
MMYVRAFLPAILALLAFLMLLRYGFHKNALILGTSGAMAVYLLAEARLSLVSTVNGAALTFTLVYAVIAIMNIRKSKRGK